MRKLKKIFYMLLALCLLFTCAAAEEAAPAGESQQVWVSVGALVGDYYYDLDLGITIVMTGEESGSFTITYPDVTGEGVWYTREKGKLVFEIDGFPVDVILTPETGYLILSLDGNTRIAFLPSEKVNGTQES